MATGMTAYENELKVVKRQLFQQITTAAAGGSVNVLEIGIGTGPNLQFYGSSRQDIKISGLDTNHSMFGYAQEAAAAVGVPSENLDLVTGDCETAPFPDAAFDFVISTLVLCSVASQRKAIEEVKRVLKPAGRFVFVEHTVAPLDAKLLRASQELLNPLQVLLADNCHLTRDTARTIREAFDEVDMMQFSVEGAFLISPHVAGVARKGRDL